MLDNSVFLRRESEVRTYCRSFPMVFDTAAGSRLFSENGRAYLDFFSGAGALNYGHNHPAIIGPVQEYLARGGILHSLDLHTVAKRKFIERFEQVILQPRRLGYRIQFTGPTGTNAVEAALKLARKVTGRSNIAAFTRGFHGVSLGSLAATASPGNRAGAGIPLGHVARLPFCGYLGPEIDTIPYIEAMLAHGSGIDLPAAFIVETVQGEGGLNVAATDWLKQLACLAKTKGILLIVDDIQAGCGRTGSFFSFERAQIEPDLVCLSKSISGCGLPMSLLLLKPEYDIWKPGEHNGTFRGNNLAFVAAAAAVEFWTNRSFELSIARKADVMKSRLRGIIRKFSSTDTKLLGLGLMQGIRWEEQAIAAAVSQEAFKRGVLVECCGPNDEVLKLLPPLTLTEAELKEGLDILEGAIAFVLGRTSDSRSMDTSGVPVTINAESDSRALSELL
jgi:diaminobutyrate-2-oxoglutarate transaminase